MNAARTWLRCPRPLRWPALRLVCFPHAGGNAAFYRPWAAHLPDDVELHGVQYPGRMDRTGEPFAADLPSLAAGVVSALRALPGDVPVVLFGHSLGASVAYETARRLDGPGGGLRALVVSGRPAPDRLRDTSVHLADDDTLWAETGRLGGTGRETLEHDGVKAVALPVLRADYRIAETWRPEPPLPLRAPVLACIGADDSEVTADEANAWAARTRGRFTLHTFGGGHFYLLAHRHRLVETILRATHRSPVPTWSAAGP
ncbi:alpha/beta fold hydrolase [Micromonospora sp. WMMC241]|uniref:thioesterase II family protein n=1 Tax=Micromonospora sp. WMMC241 TaxID=3015159 RepID=UPI0022B6D098|nr:alpha/beta fold hydrolase [Micromonospora sp. WMMC241]MCZ7437576.1 alpha/beta fold hydrolase [Micromonospora sp. WMMC241]